MPQWLHLRGRRCASHSLRVRRRLLGDRTQCGARLAGLHLFSVSHCASNTVGSAERHSGCFGEPHGDAHRLWLRNGVSQCFRGAGHAGRHELRHCDIDAQCNVHLHSERDSVCSSSDSDVNDVVVGYELCHRI